MLKEDQKSYFYLFLKSLFMILSLIGVIYAINYLNNQGLEKTAVGTLLNPNGAQVHAPGTKEHRWKLCKKDLFAVSYYEEEGEDSWKMLKAKENWRFFHKGISSPIAEKNLRACLDRICDIEVKEIKSEELIDFHDSLSYSYLDTSQLRLKLNHKKGLLMHEGQIYQAHDLIGFLKNLPENRCQ